MRSTRLWLPLAGAPLPVDERGLSFLDVIGRVAPEATRAQVDAEFESIGSGLRERYGLPGRQFSTFRAASLADETIGRARATVGFPFGAVTLLLVIACANVANPMLVRTIDLSRELAVRVSLGASRSRIVRDVALETLPLTLTGGALGAAFAYVGVEAVARVAPVDLPRLDEVTVDGRVLAFTLVLSVVVGGAWWGSPRRYAPCALRPSRALRGMCTEALRRAGRADSAICSFSRSRRWAWCS